MVEKKSSPSLAGSIAGQEDKANVKEDSNSDSKISHRCQPARLAARSENLRQCDALSTLACLQDVSLYEKKERRRIERILESTFISIENGLEALPFVHAREGGCWALVVRESHCMEG